MSGGFVGASDLNLDGGGSGASGQVYGWVSGLNNSVFLNPVEVANASGYGFDLRGLGNSFDMADCIVRSNGPDGAIADGQDDSFINYSVALNNNDEGFNLGNEITVRNTEAYAQDGIIL